MVLGGGDFSGEREGARGQPRNKPKTAKVNTPRPGEKKNKQPPAFPKTEAYPPIRGYPQNTREGYTNRKGNQG